MKKILLTGSDGFIGRNIEKYLTNSYELVSPAHSELDLLDSNKILKLLKKNAFDVVIHAATHNATETSTKDRSLVLENNLKMFFNIAEKKDLFGKMIHFGSGAEFGRDYYIPRMKEEYLGEHIPRDQYGFSKYIMARYTEEVNANIYNLRLFAVFGKYEDWRIRFISNNICNALQNKPLSINQNAFFDFLYVEDLCKITEWFIKNEPIHKTYNVCTGTSNDLYSIAESIKRVASVDLPIVTKAQGFKKEYSGNNSRLRKDLGSSLYTDFETALSELHAWFQEPGNLHGEPSDFQINHA